MRSSLWQITPDATPGLYDCLDLYWGWRVGRMVDLLVKLRGHFGSDGFIGHQQILQVIINLNPISFH